ncbi:LysR family transcriptional regulator [Phenylobacterium sp.]|uniref:LysR family transcriptional regulator n=1 Tax=Phenylobacterium sp. TaxID=1871053 RepID=UPI0035B19FD0
MNELHMRGLDLNLLRVFDALMVEGAATRAGERLGLTQSAVSHALGRLRRSLNDELFTRGPSGLRPTQRALEISGTVREAMKLLEGAIAGPRFDPARSDRRFEVVASTYLCAVLTPALAPMVMAEAPNVRLRMRAPGGLPAEALDRGAVDMVIGSFEHVPSRFRYEPLFEETAVWAIRADHPLDRPGVDPAEFARLPHLLVSPPDEPDGLRHDPGGLGLRRAIAWSEDYSLGGRLARDMDGPISVPDAYSALVVVSQSDMPALLPRRLAEVASQKGRLRLVEPDFTPEPAQFGAVTRAGDHEEGPTGWLRAMVREAAARI